MTEAPYTFGQATAAAATAAAQQQHAEQQTREAYAAYAEAERAYRRALARKIIELRAESISVTLAADLARGDDHVSALRYRRDVTEGLVEAAKQAGWRLQANRRDGHEFIAWSARRDLAEGNGRAGEGARFENVSPRRVA